MHSVSTQSTTLYNIYCTFVRCMEISLVWAYKSLSLQFVCINLQSTVRESVWSVRIYMLAWSQPSVWCYIIVKRIYALSYTAFHVLCYTSKAIKFSIISPIYTSIASLCSCVKLIFCSMFVLSIQNNTESSWWHKIKWEKGNMSRILNIFRYFQTIDDWKKAHYSRNILEERKE